jgi:hypothetical protein
MMQINQPAPDFELPDRQGSLHRLSRYRGRIVIVNFWSADCPHSDRTDRWIVSQLAGWGGAVELLSIAANRGESAASVDQAVRERGLPGVLIDAEHIVADQYEAITTPHIFVLDRDGVLRYRGAVDDVAFRPTKPTRFYLKEAVDALIAGRLPETAESPAYGCALVREI